MNIKATAMCFLPMEIAFQPHKTVYLETVFSSLPLSLNLPLLLWQKTGSTGNFQAPSEINNHVNFGTSSHTKGNDF